MSTVAEVLDAARRKLPPSEARLLLGNVMDRPAAWLLAHGEQALDEDDLLAFASLVARRAEGEPVAYLIGSREFFGRNFEVSPAVLIPRPETELLVEKALADAGTTARILDLGTGSGCIAISLALERPRAQVTAVDASAAALEVASRNATRFGATVRFLKSDWFSALRGERFDLIVANPPYIAFGDPHPSLGDLRHEPTAALVSGADGLDALRHIIGGASAYLAPAGRVWLEHGYDQATAVLGLLSSAGLAGIEQHRDLAGIVRVSGGRLRQEPVGAHCL